ncbi:MAG: hypothetical protein ACJ8C4_12935 [Gemmataceae bacterium]
MRTASLSALFCMFAVAFATDESVPIPQDPVERANRQRDTLAWTRAWIIDAYEKVGQKDPRWDKAARSALELAVKNFTGQGDPPPQESDVCSAMKLVIDAGCTDPLIAYLHVRLCPKKDFPSQPEFFRRHKEVILALQKSGYPASRRAIALANLGAVAEEMKELSASERADTAKALDAALALMPSVVAEGNGRDAQERWCEIGCMAVRGYVIINGGDEEAALQKVDAEFAKVAELKVTRILVRSIYLIHKGWHDYNASRDDEASAQAAWSKCCDLLAQARQPLADAWDVQPGNEMTATWMLWIEYGIGRDHDEMEKWFDRAMKANSDNRRACEVRLASLDPRWQGSTEAILEFGKKCRETKNWRAGITLLVGEAHLRQAKYLESQGQSVGAYLKQPHVWEEIRAVNDEYLSHFPHDHDSRSRYACLCFLAEQYTEAHRQFLRLADRVIPQRDFDAAWIKKAKETAAEKVADDASLGS